MRTKETNLIKFLEWIVGMIRLGHAKTRTHSDPLAQVIIVPGSTNSPNRVQHLAVGVRPKINML